MNDIIEELVCLANGTMVRTRLELVSPTGYFADLSSGSKNRPIK